jgi:hypothetical protein
VSKPPQNELASAGFASRIRKVRRGGQECPPYTYAVRFVRMEFQSKLSQRILRHRTVATTENHYIKRTTTSRPHRPMRSQR